MYSYFHIMIHFSAFEPCSSTLSISKSCRWNRRRVWDSDERCREGKLEEIWFWCFKLNLSIGDFLQLQLRKGLRKYRFNFLQCLAQEQVFYERSTNFKFSLCVFQRFSLRNIWFPSDNLFSRIIFQRFTPLLNYVWLSLLLSSLILIKLSNWHHLLYLYII